MFSKKWDPGFRAVSADRGRSMHLSQVEKRLSNGTEHKCAVWKSGVTIPHEIVMAKESDFGLHLVSMLANFGHQLLPGTQFLSPGFAISPYFPGKDKPVFAYGCVAHTLLGSKYPQRNNTVGSPMLLRIYNDFLPLVVQWCKTCTEPVSDSVSLKLRSPVAGLLRAGWDHAGDVPSECVVSNCYTSRTECCTSHKEFSQC